MRQDHEAAYLEEARELLGELETSLLELEQSPANGEIIGRVFRALHTIKGSGAMFGFDAVAGFTHEVETVFELVRSGHRLVSPELVELTLAAADHIRSLLFDPSSFDENASERIVASLRELAGRNTEHKAAGIQPPGTGEQAQLTYRIRFRPFPRLLATGTNPILLLNELRELGSCTALAQTDFIPSLSEMDPEACYTYWDVVLTTSRGMDAVRDVFIFVEDQCELSLEVIGEHGIPDSEDSQESRGDSIPRRLGEILVERGDIRPEVLEAALAEQEHLKAIRREHSASDAAASIRVPAEKLDALVNLVGELVTMQARLSQTASRKADAEFLSIAEEVERLTVTLRDYTMNIRMVPIGSTFSRFKRLVRDLSRELGKEVALTTDGADTELDKTVIEHLGDPLVHIIRNSIDHGIEPPEARAAQGKPRQGTVHLCAIHSGANVLIRVQDDGAGMDAEAIRAQAVLRGLISAQAAVSERELFSLIFAPGFSTARSVTSVSGRGVGLDVVKRSVEALRGTIEVESRRGKGSTITLKIPLTLAIIDGLLVRIGSSYYVLPLSIVEECVELTSQERTAAGGRRLARVRGKLVPYVRLRERFGIDGALPQIEQIVITETTGGTVGFAVDQVMGEHQTVIKNLSRVYQSVEAVSGATILGDGTVALILDVQKLVEQAELEE